MATKTAQWHQINLATIRVHLFAAVVLMSLFAASTMSVRAVSCYTDEWIDDSGVPQGMVYEAGDTRNGPFVVGSGVTRTEYYEDYHLISVETTITSPNGRSNTVFGHDHGAYYKQPWIARAESLLMWEFNDLGTYNVSSRHYSDCPVEDFGTTSYSLTIGASQVAMSRVSPGSNAFRTIEPCNVRCRLAGYIARTSAFPYASLYVPFSGDRCFAGSVVTFSGTPGQCADYYVSF